MKELIAVGVLSAMFSGFVMFLICYFIALSDTERINYLTDENRRLRELLNEKAKTRNYFRGF